MIVEIGAVWFPVTTLGYGQRLGVWFQGCSKHCAGCISPEFKIANAGKKIDSRIIIESIPDNARVDGMTISGGEPFDQPAALKELVELFSQKYTDDIIVFSGYTIDELEKRNSDTILWILSHISVLVDGTYDQSRNSGIGLRGSDNQKIHVFNNLNRYKNAERWIRRWQCVLLEDHMWMIGIPPG